MSQDLLRLREESRRLSELTTKHMAECAMCVPTCQECCGEAHEPDLVEARTAALEIRVSELERGFAELLARFSPH